jgi:ABC-2 type transport system permease protein
VSRPATLAWLAGYELRLGWRDWVALMTAGHRTRARTVVVALIVFAGFMHLLAFGMVHRYAGAVPDKATLVVISGTLLLAFALLLSQAMESVTRAFYTRSDLDLILTSPVSQRKVFSVRIGRIAVAVALVATLLSAPFINVLAMTGGVRWLAAFGVVAAMGALAAAFAVALTVALFRVIGPKRTRLIAQILAAVIGASFVIGLQVAAILSYGSLSRMALLQSEWFVTRAPDTGSAWWWPARAMMGDPAALVLIATISLAVLWTAIAVFSGRFGDHAVAAAGVSSSVVRHRRWLRAFRPSSPAQVLRQKEWTLLIRDP